MLQPVEPRLHEYTYDHLELTDLRAVPSGIECAECHRKDRERTLVAAAWGNSNLPAQERLTAISMVYALFYQYSNGQQQADGSAPVEIHVISSQAGISDKRGGQIIKHKLAGQYGLVERRAETKNGRTTVYLRMPGVTTVEDGLRIIAQFDPQTPPNTRWGGKRVKKIPANCPHCGSENTSLECIDCGFSFPTCDFDDVGDTDSSRPGSKLVTLRGYVGGQV